MRLRVRIFGTVFPPLISQNEKVKETDGEVNNFIARQFFRGGVVALKSYRF